VHVLAIVTLLASIGLLALSGWFLAASALAGLAGLLTFNYMLPAAGVRGAAIIRTAGRYAERVVSHDATFRVLSHLRVSSPSARSCRCRRARLPASDRPIC
jgi:ATP-binding cassette, subfamily C, bacterial CydC